MKISVMSDLHLEFDYFEPDVTEHDLVILAGDIHLGTKGVEWANGLGPPVIYVPGNHEYYKNAYPKTLTQMQNLAEPHVHVLDKKSIQIDGVNFIGCTLWTDFMIFGEQSHNMAQAELWMNDYRFIRISPQFRKLRANDTLALHREAMEWMPNAFMNDTKNVVITHHAPSLMSVKDCYRNDPITGAFASNLTTFIRKWKPDYWIHGHCHHYSNYVIGDTEIICNPRGYPKEPTDFKRDFSIII